MIHKAAPKRLNLSASYIGRADPAVLEHELGHAVRIPGVRVAALSENVLACARRYSDRGLCLGENVHQLVVRRAPDDTGFRFRSKDLVTRAASLDLLSPQCGTCERG